VVTLSVPRHYQVGVGINLPNLPWTSVVAVCPQELLDSARLSNLVDVVFAPSLLYSFYKVARALLRSVEY